MIARNALLSLFALLALSLTSCGTFNRAGKDVLLEHGGEIEIPARRRQRPKRVQQALGLVAVAFGLELKSAVVQFELA